MTNSIVTRIVVNDMSWTHLDLLQIHLYYCLEVMFYTQNIIEQYQSTWLIVDLSTNWNYPRLNYLTWYFLLACRFPTIPILILCFKYQFNLKLCRNSCSFTFVGKELSLHMLQLQLGVERPWTLNISVVTIDILSSCLFGKLALNCPHKITNHIIVHCSDWGCYSYFSTYPRINLKKCVCLWLW